MTPYGPVSLALLYDLRVRRLSWAERGVLHHLSLIAGVSPDGRTVPVERRPGEADVSAWEQTFGVDGARIIGDLVTRGLLSVCAEGLRVALAARDGAPAGAAPHASAPRPAADGRRGKPSESPVAQRARNDRACFKARAKGLWARTPEGLTWEQWVATEEGGRFVAEREADFPGYRGWVTPHGNAVPNAGNAPGVTPPGNAPTYVSKNPSSPGEEKKEEGNGVTGNAPRVTPQVTPPGNTPPVTPPGNAPRVTPLDLLRDAAAGRATLTGAATLEREFAEVLARHGLKGDEVSRAGSAFEEPAAWWPKGKNPAPAHVTLNDLAGFRGEAGYEWRPLAALVAHVRSQARRAAARARARPAAPPPPPPPAARAGEAAARAAARSLIADPQRPKETADA